MRAEAEFSPSLNFRVFQQYRRRAAIADRMARVIRVERYLRLGLRSVVMTRFTRPLTAVMPKEHPDRVFDDLLGRDG
jgi:hypothetical protein